jgi:TonB C terminal
VEKSPSFRSNSLEISAVGFVGTALVHTLILLPFILDLSLAAAHPPNRSGVGASAATYDDPSMTVVFINEVEPVQRLAPLKPEQLASRGAAPRDLPVVLLSPDPSSAEDASSQDQQNSAAAPLKPMGDPTQHALLYGRYLTQIQARIERAWMRPRTPIGGPAFYCRTRFTQDNRGYVIEIRLDHCNGSGRWQQSLMSAIKTASPLPAPPDPSVFADRLWLSFSSDPFDPNGSAEGFEPQAPSGLMAANNPAREPLSPEHLSSALGNRLSKTKDNTNVIHLTIIGSRTYTDSSVQITP